MAAYRKACLVVSSFECLNVMYLEKQNPTKNVMGVTIIRLDMWGDMVTNPKSINCF
jgi:hypothetical protein